MKKICGLIHGLAITVTVCCALLAIAVPQALPVAGVSSLVALGAVFPLLSRGPRLVALILIGVGGGALSLAVLLGYDLAPAELLAVNQDIVAMLAAVSVLGPVAGSVRTEGTPRLRGPAAVWRTSALVNFLGGVINLSTVTITADRLQKERGRLHLADVQIITRSFSAAAMWSPLWAGAAMALLLVPDAQISVVLLVGVLLAIATLSVSMISVFRSLGEDLPNYTGYALTWPLMRVPLAMLCSVLLLHFLFPDVPVPRFVALSALAILVIWAIRRPLRTVPSRILRETQRGFSSLRAETALFVSAGLLAIGLNALIQRLDLTLPIDSFGITAGWCCILAMIFFALLGVHQVISIGVVASFALPLQPDPTLFMSAVMIGWAVATSVGPISGLQMYMQGRYGVRNLTTIRANLPFLITVVALSWPALYLVTLLA